MRLATELDVYGCSDSPAEFRQRLIRGLIEWFPETTIDDLLCRPKDSRTFCDLVRQAVCSEWLPDAVILKALMNARKVKGCPRKLKLLKSCRNLIQDLRSAGCPMKPAEFKESVVDCLADMYKNRTIDELLCHPREAKGLCQYARRKARSERLPDDLILSTLMNVRKAGGQ
jgi:hypothetical protein